MSWPVVSMSGFQIWEAWPYGFLVIGPSNMRFLVQAGPFWCPVALLWVALGASGPSLCAPKCRYKTLKFDTDIFSLLFDAVLVSLRPVLGLMGSLLVSA